jgi:hypothetical protein
MNCRAKSQSVEKNPEGFAAVVPSRDRTMIVLPFTSQASRLSRDLDVTL